MHLHTFCAAYPEMSTISAPERFVANIKNTFKRFKADGLFRQVDKPGLYLHRISHGERTFTGLVACAEAEDYLQGRIIPHEKTVEELERKQVSLLLDCCAQLKPVMLTYREVPAISQLLQEASNNNRPFLKVQFNALNEHHSFSVLTGKFIIQRLQDQFFEAVPRVYIADGHHRMAANAQLFQRFRNGPEEPHFRFITAAFYAHTNLEIFEFSRLVTGLNGHKPSSLMTQLSQLFDISILPKGEKPGKADSLTMYLDKRWFHLTWRKEVLNDPACCNTPDVVRLEKLVFAPLLGISDTNNSTRIRYVEGIHPLSYIEQKVDVRRDCVAFCPFPMSVKTFMAISDAGGTLPPKSTWFEPRIRSGLLIRQFE